MASLHPKTVLIVGASVSALMASMLTIPTAAFAQAAPSATDSSLEEVVVTGSRLVQTGFTAPTPVTVVGQQDIQRLGVSNVADLLNTLPSFRAQSTPATVGIFSSNAGANLADLRGLGANRTLVLVDGRRFVASTTSGGGFSPSGAVDLNMIPTALIDRTEVVTGGASAAYGSDAVAGVVNLIINKNLEGIRGSVQYGQSQEADAKETLVTLAGGTSFAGGRGHIVAGGEYSNNKGTGDCYSRDWCAVSYNTISNPTPDLNGLARQVLVTNSRPATSTYGGIITSGVLRGTEFASNGTNFAHNYGTFYGTGPTFANGGIFQGGGSADPTSGFYNNFPLVAPVERTATMAHVKYDVTDKVQVFGEASYGKVESSTFGAASRNTGNITIQRDNAYLSPDLVARLNAAGQTSFSFGRIANDIGPPVASVSRETYRFVGGASGEITGSWKWDAYYQYGKTNYQQDTTRTQITDNFARAVDAVVNPANGQIVCRSTLTNPTNGCSPLNLFGENRFSAAGVAYAYGTASQSTHLTQQVAAVNVHGELFQLPAGPLSIAAGAEYRIEDVDGTADPISVALRFVTSPGSAISGPAIKVKEGYVELGVPILKDLTLVKSLSLNGAVRVTDYSTSGSVTSWKVGGVYEPNDYLRFRLTRSRDIRAANFFELYAPLSTSFQFITAAGQGSVLTSVQLGGNPKLAPEIADTFTAGVVVTPTRNLKFSADYYNIQLDGAITTLGGQIIVNRCDAGAAAFCALISRDSAGIINSVRNVNLNLNTLKTSGVDLEGSYNTPLPRGDLTVRLLGTYVKELITVDATGASVNRAGMNGGPVSQPSGLPHFTGSADFTYHLSPFTGTLQVRYISKGIYNATLIGPSQSGYSPLLTNSISDNSVDQAFYLNANAQYDLIKDGRRTLQIYGVINNLLNRDPPNDLPSSFGVTNPVLYDVIGRAFKIGVRFTY